MAAIARFNNLHENNAQKGKNKFSFKEKLKTLHNYNNDTDNKVEPSRRTIAFHNATKPSTSFTSVNLEKKKSINSSKNNINSNNNVSISTSLIINTNITINII